MRKKEHALSFEQVTRYKNYVMMQKSIIKKYTDSLTLSFYVISKSYTHDAHRHQLMHCNISFLQRDITYL